jgi:hypothetical protein
LIFRAEDYVCSIAEDYAGENGLLDVIVSRNQRLNFFRFQKGTDYKSATASVLEIY